MNFAHLHLLLNHIPVVGLPVALVFLGFGLWKKHLPSQKFALGVVLVLLLLGLATYYTGEPAEEVVENIPGILESTIETHEDIAKISLILMTITGAMAGLALHFINHKARSRPLGQAVLGVGAVAMLSLFYTANLGGKIRHVEMLQGKSPSSVPSPSINPTSDEEDDSDVEGSHG